MDTHFKINVGDLLQDSKRSDTIVYTEKFSPSFPQLIKPGIQATIELQGMDGGTIMLTFQEMLASITSHCDKCGKQIEHTIMPPDSRVICIFGEEETHEFEFDKDEDVLYFPHDEKVIDVETYLVETFQLADDYLHVCKDCQKKSS